ncbi:MAG: hypothetical protein WDM71_09860 [Ferruginibacter sp.]
MPFHLPPTSTEGSRCGAGAVLLTATASTAGDIINWYSDPGLTSYLDAGTTFTTPSISSTTSYYIVEYSTAGCTSNNTIVTKN